MKDLMMEYGIEYGMRYTKKQKEFFLQHVIEQCDKKGLKHEFITFHQKGFHITNLVIGNINNASNIICAHYDTPCKYNFSSYYPFNGDVNKSINFKNSLIRIIKGLIVAVIGIIFAAIAIRSNNIWLRFITILLGVCAFLLSYRLYNGKSNEVNFAANSAAIAVLIKIALQNNNNKNAYVLIDDGCNSYKGYELLASKLKDNQKVIILDNLSYGNDTVIVSKNYSINIMDNSKTINIDNRNCILNYFNHCIQISCGDLIDNEVIVNNVGTKLDYKIDLDRLENIYNYLIKE